MAIKTDLLKVIRKKCSDCTYNQPKEIQTCHISDCALWPYRMGQDPTTSRHGNNLKITNAQGTKSEENLKAIGKRGELI